MTITTHTGAYQEMCARVRSIVTSSDVATLVGYTPELRYDDIVYDKPKMQAVADKYWIRFTLIQAGEKRRTLSTPSRITHQGQADIQLFSPVQDRQAAEIGLRLAEMLKKSYASRTASVVFYSAGIRNMPREDQWFYKRIAATYNYETLE